MRRIVGFFVDRPLLVNMVTVAVCVGGALVAHVTTRALLPRERPRSVEVFAVLPGASAIDMESFVTFRLEEALHGIEDVKRITSTTSNGQSHLTILVKPEVEQLTKVLEETRSRLSAIRHRLPRDLLPLRIKEEGRRNNQWLMSILIMGAKQDNVKHRLAIQSLADRLRRVPNVIDVKTSIEPIDLYIRFSQKAMDRTGLDVTLARRRILEHLSHLPVGEIQIRDQDIAVELLQGFKQIEDLERLPLIVNRIGQSTTLSEVAKVTYGFKKEKTRTTVNGRSDFIELSVVNSYEADSIDISKRVRKILKTDGLKLLPPELSVMISSDASEVISHEINTLQGNGLGGVIIVFLVLMLFLGWRVGAMTAIGLPFTYLGIVLLLPLFSINFNLVSLTAMILVIGILVDDAIIVSEEFCQQLSQGGQPRESSIRSVLSVSKPVLGMVATTTVAFLPIVFIKGEASWLWRPLPIVIILALWLSLFESFFLLPNHLRHLMPSGGRFRDRRFIEWLRRLYRRSLHWVLKLRYVSLLVVAGLVMIAVLLLMGPVKFKTDENFNARALLYVELKEAAFSLDELAMKVKPVEQLVETLPKELVKHYKTELGRAWTLNWELVRGFKYALIRVVPSGTFTEQEERRFEVAKRLEQPLKELEKKGFARLRFFENASPDTRDVVTVYVSGGDRIDLKEIQNEIRTTLQDIKEIKDVFMDETRFQRSYRFDVDEAKVLAYGLSKSHVHEQLREHFSQKELLRFRNRGEEVEVFLGFQNQAEPTLKQLGQLSVINGQGTAVPLRYIGKWQENKVLRRIEHQDLLRMFKIDVLYDRKRTDAGSVAGIIEKKLESVREHFPGYHISVKPSEAEAETKAWLYHLLAVCLVLIYVCLALSLNSLIHPIVVIFAIPFGFIGVVLAFYLHGMMLGMMAVVGILGLTGVVVNDSLVMTSTINKRFRSDPTAGMRQAILDGAAQRFRAVILTSLTTLGGVFPLAYGFAGKAGFLQPMVLAVGWGLLFATLLTLFFLPCLLMILHDIKRALLWIVNLPGRILRRETA